MKSNMTGALENYKKMFKEIMSWGEPMGNHCDLYKVTHPVLGNEEGHFIYNLGYDIGEMGYHGWVGEAAMNEVDIEKRVSMAYYCLVKALAEAIGYDYEKYDPESLMYKYHLKDLNIDEVLKWK